MSLSLKNLITLLIILCLWMPLQAAAENASQHAIAVQNKDRNALIAAKNAIVSYALAAGKLPSPVDKRGCRVAASATSLMPPSSGVCPELDPLLDGVVPGLGVNNWGAFGSENPFRFDVNDALTGTTSMQSYCAALQTQLQLTSPPLPTADGVAMAFVLYSTGADHKPNQKNKDAITAIPGTPAYRNYESEARALDNSPETSLGTVHYDDQLIAVPLATLVAQCGTVDVGAAPVCSIDATPANISVGESVTLTASATDVPNNCSACTWEAKLAGSLVSNPVSSLQNSSGGSVSPTLTTTYTVSASNDFGSCSKSVQVNFDPCHASAQACLLLDGNVNDSSGNNVSSTLHGTFAYVVKGGGQAFSLSGSPNNGYVHSMLKVNQTGYSASMWFKTSVKNNGFYSLGFLKKWWHHDRDLYLDASGKLCAYTYNRETICSTGTYADGVYHHVAHVLNGVNQILYIDGVQAAIGSKGKSNFWWQNIVYIGFSHEKNNNYFTGEIDNVQIFNKALTAAEVAQLAAAPQ